MTGPVVTQPRGKSIGRPARWVLSCDVCDQLIGDDAPVVFALQESGGGPYPGYCGWYTATACMPCATPHLRAAGDYHPRPCRGCERPMWCRPRARRTHCTGGCRQADYRRRRDLNAAALRTGQVIYRDDLYHLTRPCQEATA